MSGPQPHSPNGARSHLSTGAERGGVGSVRRLGTHRVVGVPTPLAHVDDDARSSVRIVQFVEALLSSDDNAAPALATSYIESGTSPEDLFESVFPASARRLGDLWLSDDCSFYDVTVGSGRIHRLVRQFSPQFIAQQHLPGHTGRVLLAVAAEEQHSLGVAVLAEFFVRDGWDVHIEPGLASEGLLDKVRDSEYDLLGFSVSVSARIAKLQQDIRRSRQVSRNRDIRVLIGGQLITADPSLSSRIGADGYAVDARSAVREARRLISA